MAKVVDLSQPRPRSTPADGKIRDDRDDIPQVHDTCAQKGRVYGPDRITPKGSMIDPGGIYRPYGDSEY